MPQKMVSGTDQLMPFGVTAEELELARRIATEVLKTYGDFDDADYYTFMEHGIWNDHCSVQTAIAVIKHMKAVLGRDIAVNLCAKVDRSK